MMVTQALTPALRRQREEEFQFRPSQGSVERGGVGKTGGKEGESGQVGFLPFMCKILA